MISFFAKNQKHFVSHLWPIYNALPTDIRGPFYARGRAAQRCEELGIAWTWPPPRWSQRDIVVTASFEDLRSARPAKIILLNHGAGQTYQGPQHPAYSGGTERERCILFLEPSERVAAISRAAYPDVPAVAVGVPYLDRFLTEPIGYNPQLVAMSFHADVSIVPETHSAFPYYRQSIIDLAHSGKVKLLGHSHPRSETQIRPFWESLGIEFEPDWLKVLDRAGVYVVDNSSTGYEFAATNRPVIWLNQPSYRRDIHHGLRFWDLVPGQQVDRPDNLAPVIERTVRCPHANPEDRRRIIEQVYNGSVLDGRATERAVEAILQVLAHPLTAP